MCVSVPTCAHIQAMECIVRVIVPDRAILSAKEIPLMALILWKLYSPVTSIYIGPAKGE